MIEINIEIKKLPRSGDTVRLGDRQFTFLKLQSKCSAPFDQRTVFIQRSKAETAKALAHAIQASKGKDFKATEWRAEGSSVFGRFLEAA